MKNAVAVPDEILELRDSLEAQWAEIRHEPAHRLGHIRAEAQPGAAPAALGGEGDPGAPGGEGDAGAGGEGAAGAAPSIDPRVFEQMQAQMQQFGGVVGQVAEYLPALEHLANGAGGGQQAPGGGQAAGGGDPAASLDELAQGFAELYGGQGQVDAYGNPVPPDPQQARALVEQFRDVVRAEIAPLQEGFQTLQGTEQSRQLQALSAELPALREPDTANAVAERAVEAAELFLGPQATDADIARASMHPRLVRMAALAHIAEQRAASETPAAGSGPDPLEGGAGTSPGEVQGDPGDAIVAAGRTGGTGAGAHFRT